ncbi:PREDICTED: neuropeptides capa receptor-like [Priapulus caudatus]|uniref:Neuropeptides capa receptor-like n=1 Tax=Priapulus caudatus TaxID=37621 RepID=A0ABM1DPF2_PRICU|nr:PREDICTED: neuropeptides capa receptor-like [Priapulus caudatus]
MEGLALVEHAAADVTNDDVSWSPAAPVAPTSGESANVTSIYDHLADKLGPQRDPLTAILPISTLYVIIFITGVLGNVSTCVVIARNRYMHTATNFYLFSLAVSDLLLLVLGLPQELVQYWHQYPYPFSNAFCVMRGMAAETALNSSIMTITAFTVERYFAICHPIRNHKMSKLSRVIKIIVGIWIIGALMSLPIILNFGVIYVRHPETGDVIAESAQCNVFPDISPRIFEVSTFLFFFAPMCIITVLYLLIGYELRKMHLSRVPSDSSTNSGEVTARLQVCARRAVLKMLSKYIDSYI